MRERVGRRRHLAGEERVEPRFGELARPPDQLERLALAVAGDAPRRPALRAPGVEPLEARRASKLEALLELERLARDDEHLDVRHVVGHAPRHASREHDLLRDLDRNRVRNPLRERLQLLAPRRRHIG